MRRYELGISLDYVQDWGIVEAVREIFQNALDEQIVNPENEMYYEYDACTERLLIGNKKSNLATKSLLLGSTTKANNDKTIGRHGEGYKVATAVLLRNGCSVTVHNNERNEDWVAKVVDSRRYGTKIPVFDVKSSIFSNQKCNLLFEIGGISEEAWKEIISKNLHLRGYGNFRETSKGRILFDEEFKGQIYVNGLYVCSKSFLEMGYDFNPELIKLDRDRGLIDSFDLQFAIGRLLVATEDNDFIFSVKNTNDARYVSIYLDNMNSSLYEKCYLEFIDKNGEDAVPYKDMDDFNYAKKQNQNAVYVSDSDYSLITRAPSYSTREIKSVDYDELFEDWCNRVRTKLSETEMKEICDLWGMIRK